MLDPTLAAAKMKEQIGSHDSPPQPWPPTHGGIGIRDIQYALLDEIDDFTIERGLQAVSDVSNDFLANMNRFLADRCVEGDRPLDGFG